MPCFDFPVCSRMEIFIPKPGKLLDSTSFYRPITLLPVISKILGKI